MPSDLGQNSGCSSGRSDVRGGFLEPALCSLSWSACSGVQSQHWESWDTTWRDKKAHYVRQSRKQGGNSWLNTSRGTCRAWEECRMNYFLPFFRSFLLQIIFPSFPSEFTCFFHSCISFFSPPFLQEAQ